ncbi:MAG: hypothetical protein CTY31_13040 [Hyphomicrobium sp.]|nr:MAG: hypothetical protein CTY31_13040 [Hyphomicrobium sp.]
MTRCASLLLCSLLTAIGAGITPVHAQTAQILWQVDNPFRFFTDPLDTEVHRATYRALGPEDRNSPVLASERALQRRHDDGWAATMYKNTCWNASTNRFTCETYDDYMNPKQHQITAEISGIEDAQNLSCTWLTSPNGGASPRGKAVTQPCNEKVSFAIPYPEGSTISVEIGGRDVAKADAKVQDLLVVAMGDSFASGEGNPDVPVRFSRDRIANYGKPGVASDLSGFPARIGDWRQIGDKAFISENARWLDQACHRSLYSHQLRAALQLAIEDPHRSVTFVGVSCSGAEVTFGLFLRYKGNEWVPNPPVLSQVSAIAEAQCGSRSTRALDLPEAYHINGKIPELKGGLVLRKCDAEQSRKIDLVFLSIGGNDIGFSRLVANAVLSSESMLRQLGGWIGEVHGQTQAANQLAALDARYKSLNRAIHSLLYVPWKESDRIILASYPGLALSGDGSEVCKDSRAGMEIVADFQLSEQKLREGAWIADKLHREMRDSAERYGWTFVETHRRAFIDRGLCSGWSEDGTNPADELRIPRKIDGVWKPYNPADYKAYASRQRWFRTPNDGFMTGNFHVAASLLQKVLKLDSLASFQLLLAATYSGSFHPTAEGQAAIADAVVDKARVVLQKYDQGPSKTPVFSPPGAPPPVDEPDTPLPDIGATAIGKPPATDGVTAPPPITPQPDAMPAPTSPPTIQQSPTTQEPIEPIAPASDAARLDSQTQPSLPPQAVPEIDVPWQSDKDMPQPDEAGENPAAAQAPSPTLDASPLPGEQLPPVSDAPMSDPAAQPALSPPGVEVRQPFRPPVGEDPVP